MTSMPLEPPLKDLVIRVHRVRQWLIRLKAMRATSTAMGYLSGIAVINAGLCRACAGQITGRGLCDAVFLCSTVAAILWILHTCRRPISYRDAGAQIEGYHTYHRQLVTAMEYYEAPDRFPYSTSLTQQMVKRVSQRSRAHNFEACIPKDHLWIYSVIIGLELSILGGFWVFETSFWMHQSTSSAQTSGLQAPVPLQDIPALERVTQDILGEPNSLITFSSKSQLRVLPPVHLVIQPIDSNGAPASEAWSCPVSGVQNPDDGSYHYSVQQFIESSQHCQYRFESATNVTPWSNLTIWPRPRVQAAMSRTRHPQAPWDDSPWSPINHSRVEVIEGREVALNIQTDQALSQIQVHQEGKLLETVTLDDSQTTYKCLPRQRQALTFTPINEKGQAVQEPFYVELEVKADQRPYFKLQIPEGDLSLTSPGPVTVNFWVCDDVGLDQVALCYEIKNSPAIRLEEPMTDPIKEVTLARTLPLDQWNLQEGDTVMFYAAARDISLDPNTTRPEAFSEIYLIEIQREPQIKPPSKNSFPNAVETLQDALEYLRAIIKKTWVLSHARPWTPLQQESICSLAPDLEHTIGVIESNRDNKQLNFSPQDTATLYEVTTRLSQALDALQRFKPSEAMEPEKRGYRLLRDLIQEQDRTLDQSPSSSTPMAPEKLKVQSEPNQPAVMNEQEAKDQLNKIQKQVESLIQRQKQLNSTLNKALAPPSEEDAPASPYQASADMHLNMMAVQQKSLQTQAEQIQTALDQVGQNSSDHEKESSQQAAQHMQQAVEAMDAMSPQHGPEQSVSKEALDQLIRADTALDESLLESREEDQQVKRARRLIEQLMQDVESMSQNPQPANTKAMEGRLSLAEQLLKKMGQSQSSAGQSVAHHWDMPSTWIRPNYASFPASEPARIMIQRLWSATLTTSSPQGQAVKIPNSVGQFWELENSFFERTSQYPQGGTTQ